MAQSILITGPERRRRWSGQERLAILSEAFAPGASPIEVARRHEISSGLLYTWRKKALAYQAPPDGTAAPVFLPAFVIAPEPPIGSPAAAPADNLPVPAIEVHFKRGVTVHIEAGVPEMLITATLKALQ